MLSVQVGNSNLKVTRHITRSEEIQSYSTVVLYSLMLAIKDSKVDVKSVHQSPKITKFHSIVKITSQSVSCMVASGYNIDTDWWLKIRYNI